MARTISFSALLVALSVATSLSGCFLFRRQPSRVVVRPSGQSGEVGVAGGRSTADNDIPAREALERVEGHLTQRGYARTGPAVRNSSMPQNGLVAYALDAQRGQCYIAIALAAPGTDLNMVVIDPQGAAVGHNVLPDAHPWVEICAATQGRHVVRVQMVRGSGEYYYAVYQRRGEESADIARLYGDSIAGATVRTATLDAETQRRVTDADQRLSSQRYTRVSEPQGVHLARREDRNFPLNLQGGYCYAFGTFGGPGTVDTDVFVVDGSGNELVVDQGTERDGLVEFCPPVPGSYTLRARLYDGDGPVFVSAWARATTSSSAALPPDSTLEVVGSSRAAEGLDERFALLDADMIARGYEHYGESARGELSQGQSQDFGISLEGSKCYAIVAVGEQGVRDMDLAVLDAEGRELDRDVEADSRPIVRVCPERSGESRIQVRMSSGGGAFRYSAYRWPRGTRGPFNLNGLIYVRLAEVTALLDVDGYQPSVDFMPDRGTLRRSGEAARHRLYLPANRCVSLLVVGGDGVHDLDVSIGIGGTQLARDATHNAFPDLRFCTERQGEYDIEITGRAGAGEYFYQVFERSP